MLPLPQISKKNYTQLVDEVIQKIPSLTKEWTDFNAHDPGITMLQNFAWLSEMQQYYGEAIGDVHIWKYLKLLGYKPRRAISAKGIIMAYDVEEDMEFPRGTKLLAGDICYEFDKNEKFVANELEKVYRDKELVDLSDLMSLKDNSYECIFSNELQSHFYLGFKNTIELQDGFKIYFKIDETQKMRGKFDDQKFVLSRCSWEIYTDKGWEKIENVQDHTAHFLRDGHVCLKGNLLSQETALIEDDEARHYLRCMLTKNEYDILPRIRGIGINCAMVSQQESKIISLYLSGTGEDKQEYRLEHYLALKGKLVVCVEEEGRWRTLKETQDYTCSKQEDYFRYLCFEAAKGEYKPKKAKRNIKVICYDKKAYDEAVIGTFKGYANQSFELNQKEDFYKDIELSVRRKKEDQEFYESYKRVYDLESCGAKTKAYVLTDNQIRFGDRHHGTFPRDKNAELVITELAFTKGFKGNIKENKITEFMDEDLREKKNIRFTNSLYIGGGEDEETIKGAIMNFRLLLSKKKRAISRLDYEEIVKSIPGLLIHKVKAISESVLNKEVKWSNKIYIVVEPYAEKERARLSPIYKKVIEETLEQYRLLTAEIEVVSPVYVPIDVYACIYKRIGFDEQEIYKTIKGAVEGIHGDKNFGESLIRGKLFGDLSSLEGVIRIEYLSLELASKHGEKTLSGDILIKPNELTYLRNYHIELR